MKYVEEYVYTVVWLAIICFLYEYTLVMSTVILRMNKSPASFHYDYVNKTEMSQGTFLWARSEKKWLNLTFVWSQGSIIVYQTILTI